MTTAQLHTQAPSRAPGCSHGQVMKERGAVGWGLEGAGLTLLLGQRPDSAGGTLQSPSLALRLQHGPGAAATKATEVRQGWDSAHGLDRALCWWHMWDTDTDMWHWPSGHLPSGAGWDQHHRSQNLQLLEGGLPALHCDLIRSAQRKCLRALASAQARQQRASAGESGHARHLSLPSSAVLQQHPLTPAWAPLGSTPQGPHGNISKVLVPVSHASSSIKPSQLLQTPTYPRCARLQATPLSPTLLPRLWFWCTVLVNGMGADCF